MTTPAVLGTLVLMATVAACGGQSEGVGHPEATSSSASPEARPAAAAGSTPELDAIAVLGHSGTTGYGSDPGNPDSDVVENSWATGSNPDVRSLYERLLADHPALENHATSLGQDGSTVDDLDGQVTAMLDLEPMPDVVVIQTIDNDMRCDGTDAANEKRFGRTLDDVLTRINDEDRYAQVFFVSQWGSVQTYTDAIQHRADAVAGSSGNGPCDTFGASGKERPAGIASEQRIVDGYWSQITRVCAAHPGCFTDGAHVQKMPVLESDLTGDSNHLGVPGLAVMAQYAWEALPDAIKDRT
ncbi:hypothetical protein ACVW00_000209 [Marmoricola sp. URHA0025 HA25]